MGPIFMIYEGAGKDKTGPAYFAAVLSDSHIIEAMQHLDGYKYRIVCKKEMSVPVERCDSVSEAEFYIRLNNRAKTIRHFIEVYSHYLSRLEGRS